MGSIEAVSRLGRLWAQVLGIDVDRIGEHPNFLSLGGDSVAAVRLVGAARKEGLSLTVADIIQNPTIDAQAAALGKPSHEAEMIASFVPNDADVDAYWTSYLSNAEIVPFPPLPSSVKEPRASQRRDFEFPLGPNPGVTKANMIRGALALLIGQHTSSSDVIFGEVRSGRWGALVSMEDVCGPTTATVPVRALVQKEQRVQDFLKILQWEQINTIQFEQMRLSRISQLGEIGQVAAGFQTLLLMRQSDEASTGEPGLWQGKSPIPSQPRVGRYSLELECILGVKATEVKASFDPEVIDAWLVERMIRQLGAIVEQLQLCWSQPDMIIGQVSAQTAEDREMIWRWNQSVPPTIHRCVHDIISEQAQTRPNTPAVCAWDGDLTYWELDNLSTRLARHLKEQYLVGPETAVPLCCEKSVWTVVAILAVLKAGGAFVPLDPTQAAERRQLIIQQTNARLILTTTSHAQTDTALYSSFVVDRKSLAQLSPDISGIESLPVVDPSSAAYILFTSGSSGTPKGVVIEHQAISTSSLNFGISYGCSPSSRVLQFASYTFDVSVGEIVTTLCLGGCVCVPSERERVEDLAGFIRAKSVNLAVLTPTVARTLPLEEIPSLRTLAVIGEAVTPLDFDKFRQCDSLRFFNVYGPTECSVIATVEECSGSWSSPDNIGTAVGCVTWVVDQRDHDVLAPLGAVGELVLEGAIVARGYLNDADKTKVAFIENPPWLNQTFQGQMRSRGRLYRTGDLVRYNHDGSLSILGRKDDQVKIRGHRVELGEIEYHVRKCLSSAKQVVAEIINPDGDASKPMLSVFLTTTDEGDNNCGAFRSHGVFRTAHGLELVAVKPTIEAELALFLPAYMIPSLYLRLEKIPLLSSGKTNRKLLRNVGSSLSTAQVARLRNKPALKLKRSLNETERVLRALWAQFLSLDESEIGHDDSFYHLGGDSVIAMKLVGAARRADYELKVADVLTQPVLAAQSLLMTSNSESKVEIVAPFSLFDEKTLSAEDLCKDLVVPDGHHVDASIIEDAYPCSALQEGLMSLSLNRPGSYVCQAVLELSKDVQIGPFMEAWEEVFKTTPILRTRILHHRRRGLVQVVYNEGVEWTCLPTDEFGAYLDRDKALTMGLGDRLSRLALIGGNQDTTPRLVWTMHHALYDGWSLSLMERLVVAAYEAKVTGSAMGAAAPLSTSFNGFIKYLGSSPERQAIGNDYWKSYFANGEFTPFPFLPPAVQKPMGDQTMELSIDLDMSMDVTKSTILRGALAFLLGQYTGNADVVFGTTLAGRNTPGLDETVGPTVATVPVRVNVSMDQTVAEFLHKIQSQAVQMIPFEQTGLSQISRLDNACRTACEFQTLLVVQPQHDLFLEKSQFGKWIASFDQDFATYALTLECFIDGRAIKIRATYDGAVLSEWKMGRLMHQFKEIMRQLSSCDAKGTKIGQLDAMTTRDKEVVGAWNHRETVVVEKCIHDVIFEHARKTPDKQAVFSWDGGLTYRELDDISSRLAAQLIYLGVGPEVIVPVCFEKSKWAVVATLAVLKSGGAFVLLDSNLPDERLRRICQQVAATVAVASASSQTRLGVSQTILLDQETLEAMPLGMTSQRVKATPFNAAYVIFTSGSTGEPKGCVIEHYSYCSVASHGQTMKMDGDTRTLQFGSYSFAGAIMEILMTLMYGGCVCVPSEEQRRDGRLSQTIRELGVTWAFLTSTVLSQLRPEDVPSLRTICIGGESIRTSQIAQWASKVQLRQTYGSSETSAVISSARLLASSSTSSDVGRAETGRFWIVNPEDPDRLMPVGVPGEIVIEGPTIGRTYLDLPEKTAKTFIRAPSWRSDFGAPMGTSRFYRTGDIGALKKDGSIELLGRKDMQVKLRGQRIEIGEIEYQTRMATPTVKAAAVELAVLGDSKTPALVGFLVLDVLDAEIQEKPARIIDKPDAKIAEAVATVYSALETVLPHYMVPSILVPISRLPLTPSGKIDRRTLRQMGSKLSEEELTVLRSTRSERSGAPRTEMERRLRDIWAQVLNTKAERISVDDSFFRIGGDSITAMQVSSTARAILGEISTQDIFKKKTISRLAAQISSSGTPKGAHALLSAEKEDQPFQLSPIQRLYTLLEPDPTRCFDQGFFLKLRSNISAAALHAAIESVVFRHPMLRSRFTKTQDGWQQQVVEDVSGSIHIKVLDFSDPPLATDEKDAIRSCREAIDILNGPILTAVLINEPSAQKLFITAHHIVIDLVSWRVLLQELETLFSCKELATSPSMSFQTWTTAQALYVASENHRTDAYKIQSPLLNYWGIESNNVVEGATAQEFFVLDASITASLLGKCNEAFGTKPLELLLAALVHSFHLVFQDRPLPDVLTEGHGREPWDEKVDVSRTVGWFTTLFPVPAQTFSGSDLLATVRQVKDWIRGLPNNGWSYFNSLFADHDKAVLHALDFPCEILFNFLGSFQQLERDDSLLENLAIPPGTDALSFSGMRRFSVFSIEARIDRGRLSIMFDHPRKLHHQDRIEAWIGQYQAVLEQLTTTLQDRSPEWTVSDFPRAFTSFGDILEFKQRILPLMETASPCDIEDIYPCSPIQEGIIMAQSKDSRLYRTALHIELLAPDGDVIDISRVEQAWRSVVRRHALLRAVIVDNMPGANGIMIITLRDPEPSVSLEYQGAEQSRREVVNGQDTGLTQHVSYQRYGLQHHLSICRHDGDRLQIWLEINHAISDGHSHSTILLRDLRDAYQHQLDPHAPSYADFANDINLRSLDDAGAFWKQHLVGIESCLLSDIANPSMRDETGAQREICDLDLSRLRQLCSKAEITAPTVIQMAWGLVLGQFTDSTVPCFGAVTSGRDVAVKGVDEIFGPVMGLMPVRFRPSKGMSVIDNLRLLRDEYVASLPHQMYPLMRIHNDLHVGPAGLFNTFVNYQKLPTMMENHDGLTIRTIGSQDPLDFDIAIDAIESGGKLNILLSFGPGFASHEWMTLISNALRTAILVLIENSQTDLGHLSLLGKEDGARIWEWNKLLPPKIHGCVHDLVRDQAKHRPDAVAISAWDGELTYGELDTISTKLARYLVKRGAKPGMIIPLCFEKSMWTLLTVLAVSKAGGTVVLFDTALPVARLRSMWKQCKASIACASEATQPIVAQLGVTPIVVGSELLGEICEESIHSLPAVDPETAFYVCFTSGSTGQPKGVLVSHSNYRSAFHYQIEALGIDYTSRVYDFASYSFDGAFLSTFAGLSSGACLCIPSEEQRKDSLNQSLNDTKATLVILTPSVARVLEPDRLPSLQTLILTGEAVTLSDVDRLWGHFCIKNVYGPCECTPLSTLNTNAEEPEMVTGIGVGMGCRTWVVDQNDHDRLLPVGAVGELLIEGPIVGQGYLGEPDKTAAAFISSPVWLRDAQQDAGGQSRLYKTGDLVRYSRNGSLNFVRRKDSQVKIRGQRVELDEVESHVRECFPETQQLVVDVMVPEGKKGNEVLVIILETNDEGEDNPLSMLSNTYQVTAGMRCTTLSRDLQMRLAERLPSYMIPSFCLIMSRLPTTTTDKIDRKRLHAMGSELSWTQLAELRAQTLGERRQPQTEREHKLRALWEEVLEMDGERIGIDDNFFILGGDSIVAMKLAAAAREAGLILAVSDIFQHPTIAGQAQTRSAMPKVEVPPPFSLFGDLLDAEQLRKEIAELCGMHVSSVEDAYPCTPLQEGLLSLSAKRTGDYVMQATLQLDEDVSLDLFKTAWQRTFKAAEILRTRIVHHSQCGLLQAVVEQKIEWIEAVGLREYVQADREKPMGLGQPLSRYALIRDGASREYRWFVWTMHHSLYDDWSLPLILDAVDRQYSGGPPQRMPGFQLFMKNLSSQSVARTTEYWRGMMAGCEGAPFPSLPPSIKQPMTDHQMEQQLPSIRNSMGITPSNLVQAAWALVMGRTTSSDDVVFGITVSGRKANVSHIESMPGPTIATVPWRTKLDRGQGVLDYLEAVQRQATDMIPFEQAGLQRISQTSADAQRACAFQTLLVIQPPRASASLVSKFGEWRHGEQQPQWFNSYALVLHVELGRESIKATAEFDSRVVEPWLVQRLLARLDFVMQQLVIADGRQKLGEISTMTSQDLVSVWELNREVPAASDRLLHEMVDDMVQAQPTATAICSWDGEMSYQELDDLSSKVAGRLLEVGLEPNAVVPLCFDKSMWAPVAMLGVAKAGAAFVMLEPSLPQQRLEAMVRQVKSDLILSSASNSALSSRLVRSTIEISPKTVSCFTPMAMASSKLPCSAPLFVVFTSGSTGTPKGALASHQNLASAIMHQASLLGLNAASRVFDFASYAFDGSIYNAFATFSTGGCLCIPSDRDRKDDTTESMAAMRVTFADLTPTVARLLDPLALPTLQTLMLSGEAVSVNDVAPWWGRCRIVNGYGPAECGTLATLNHEICRPEEAVRIGRGAGVVTWVVDAENHEALLPPGCIGELLLEGPLVGLGYVGEPERTAAAFIQDPAWLVLGGRSGRLYKTGDLVRYNKDGSLTYVGRKDAQVKLRGQRLELGEVEHWVRECEPRVRHVAAEVITPGGEDASRVLAAFLEIIEGEGEGNDAPATCTILTVDAATEDKLAEHLPGYMLPTVFLAVRRLPMTSTGKIDRRMLREIGASFTSHQLAEAKTRGGGPKRPPTTRTEWLMRGIWARVLKMDRCMIGLDDSFMQLGGESIAAMKMAGEAKKMGLQLSVADMFRYPRLHAMARRVVSVVDGAVSEIPTAEHHGPVVQSFAQARLWFLEQLYSGLNWYHMPWGIRLRGHPRLEALKAAILAIEKRHEILRTTFDSQDGANVQVVHAFEPRELRVVDLGDDEAALAQGLDQEQTRLFDLERESGWRVSIFRMGEGHLVVSIVMHHIISDGWSIDILSKELAVFYSAAIHGNDLDSCMAPLPIQYRDYSVWQHQQTDEHARQLKYWVQQLESSRPAELLPDKPRPTTLSGRAETQDVLVQGSLYRRLRAFCKDRGITPFVALLAAFRATHYRLTGATDATIGTGNANRDRWEMKDMVGFFVNMQCIRSQVQGDETFEALVQQVQAAVTASFANQDVPFDRVVSALNKGTRDLSRNPLFQICFSVHAQEVMGDVVLEDVETESLVAPPNTRFDLEFHLFQKQDAVEGYVFYSTDLYHEETMRNVLDVYRTVLDRVLDEPGTPISVLPLMQDTTVVVANGGCPYPREMTLVDAFDENVAAYPDAIAVKDSSGSLTYAQLDEASEAVARWILKEKQLSRETLVGVYAGRCRQTVAAYLGIIKAGCAYLPLDIKNPLSRIEAILSSVEGRKVVLVGPNIQAPHIGLRNVEFVRIQDLLDRPWAGERLAAPVSPSSLAYVIFTSGSTGKPKGVMIEHRSLLRLAKSDLEGLLPRRTVASHISNIAFDASACEIWATILNGGTVVCIDAMAVLDYEAVTEIFSREKIQTAFCTPALLKQYLAECPSVVGQLEAILVGGEKLDAEDTATALALMRGRGGKVINVYGPTETTVWSAFHCVSEGELCENGVPIGRAISGSHMYVLDRRQLPVPVGVLGELVVVGECLARGYMDAEQDRNRFVTITVDGEEMRAYRTGDYGRYRAVDGKLEFMGRIDGQVKIRGQRVELGEIEHVMTAHERVQEAVVVVQGQEVAQLAGFITINEGQEVHRGEAEQAESHIELWRELWDSDKYSKLEETRGNRVGRDFLSWVSMYDGRQIAAAEMEEWLDDTMRTIDGICGGEPGRVIEVGTGSGMILFSLGQKLESYYGLEPTATAVRYVTKTILSRPALADKAVVRQLTAADVSQLRGVVSPDLAIVNSVAQYFPSQDYLLQLVEDLLRLGSTRTLFFGDMRSHAMYRQFQVSAALRLADGRPSREQVRRKMAAMEQAELELLVDPAFFMSLPGRLPGLVEHVEILPKSMRATNEVSCYRYAAVVYAQLPGIKRDICEIGERHWIDFMDEGMDRDSLRQLLEARRGSESSTAVGNIPWSKTILERFALESLEDDGEGDGWLESARHAAEGCSALSALDLEEVAAETGFGVRVSWARQRLQNGGLDAVFYPTNNGIKGPMLFRFPTDPHDRPFSALTTHPLRRQLEERVISELRESLKQRLPTYMIPQQVVVLDRMPVNVSGKVDRQALARSVREPDLAQVNQEKRQPVTEREGQMQGIWAYVLSIEATAIGLDDNFFELGGNSILAMRCVGLARKLGMQLTVADVFRYPKLVILVRQISHRGMDIKPPEDGTLVNAETKAALVAELGSMDVEDVLPLTSMQRKAVCADQVTGPWCHYFYLDLGLANSPERTRQSIARSLEKIPLLRSHFLEIRGGYWQVVLRHMEVPLSVIDVGQDGDVNKFFERFCLADLEALSKREPPFAATLIRYPEGSWRVVFRLNHAQYDGVSFPALFASLLNGDAQDAPLFSSFLSYAARKRPDSIRYWTSVLRAASPPTRLMAKHGDYGGSEAVQVGTEIAMPTPPKGITCASLVSAAWAVLLSRVTGQDDVVFGHVVSGRNSTMPGIEAVVGPCFNIVPLRVAVAYLRTTRDLLACVQRQMVDMGEADSLGTDDIVGLCTDWPEGTILGSVVQHQNIDESPMVRFGNGWVRLGGFDNPRAVAEEVTLMSYPRGGRLEIVLLGNSRLMSMERARTMVDELVEIIGGFE